MSDLNSKLSKDGKSLEVWITKDEPEKTIICDTCHRKTCISYPEVCK